MNSIFPMSTGPGFCLVSSINSKNGELDMELGMRAISLNWEPFSNLSPWGSAFSLEASSKNPNLCLAALHLPIAPSQSGTLSHRCAEARPYQVRTRNQGRDLEGQGLCHGFVASGHDGSPRSV